ncbi:MAG: hypothetical protein IJQ55_01310, partial [Alphaproteobacteria bacterium]|nr:hypothetical protein [Alphaproteobacteria bacterium]
MKKIFCILFSFMFITPSFAEGEQQQQQALDRATIAAAASYVDGAYDAMNTAKQDKLTSSNVVESGSGAMVTGVTASNG